MVKSVFEDLKDELSYEVELRFNPQFVREFQDFDEEKIEEIMARAAEVFLLLAQEPASFSA